jgi:hypothetical protein
MVLNQEPYILFYTAAQENSSHEIPKKAVPTSLAPTIQPSTTKSSQPVQSNAKLPAQTQLPSKLNGIDKATSINQQSPASSKPKVTVVNGIKLETLNDMKPSVSKDSKTHSQTPLKERQPSDSSSAKSDTKLSAATEAPTSLALPFSTKISNPSAIAQILGKPINKSKSALDGPNSLLSKSTDAWKVAPRDAPNGKSSDKDETPAIKPKALKKPKFVESSQNVSRTAFSVEAMQSGKILFI